MHFEENEALRNLWKSYNPGPGLEKPEFHDMLVQIERFIGPVFHAIVNEDEFFKTWMGSKNEWS